MIGSPTLSAPSSLRVLTWCVFGLLALGQALFAGGPPQAGAHTQPLDSGWEYRWGDSPFVDGEPVWATDGEALAWHPILFPSDPPERNGRSNVWYRIRLPEEPLGDSIYIYSIDLSAEVYLDGERIYRYGEFDEDGRSRFEGWPWHIIRLPSDYAGKYLYFRVYSDYPDIGLWGEVALGDEYAHLQKILRRELLPVGVSLALALCGLTLLLCFPLHRQVSLMLMSLFLINLGSIPVLESQIKQMLFFAPVLCQFLAAGAYFLLPVSMAALVHSLAGRGPCRIHQCIWLLHLAYIAVAMVLSAAGAVNLSAFYIYFDLLALLTMLILSITLFFEALEGDIEIKTLALGFWILYAIMVYNGLTAHGILPYAPRSEYLGPLVLGICFAAVLAHRHTRLGKGLEVRTTELEAINANLESLVEARTSELQKENEAKNQFFAIIGHDLKAPIGTIHNLLREYEKDGTGVPADDVPEMREGCGRIYQLLESLLAWARGQQGQLTPQKSHFDTHLLTEQALGTLRREAASKQIRVQTISHDAIPLYADKGMLTTVLRNLVANAIKFTPTGGRICIEFHHSSDEVRCTCSDNGLGMSDDQLAGLFSPKDYDRIGAGTGGEKGSGLGLLLCREFVHVHGGTIGAEHEASGGTTIWFTLPV